jgi:hypothetical protein
MRKAMYIVVAILVVAGLWYALRPEKLFVTQRVSEAPPAGITAAWQIVSTGSFTDAGRDQSSFAGRASIATQAGGKPQLQLTGLDPKVAAGLQVTLTSGTNTIALGTLTSQPDQSFPLPSAGAKYDAVTLTSTGSHANQRVARAVLEDF